MAEGELTPNGVPIENWITVPVSDSSDYLDRPDPVYDTSLRAPTGDEEKEGEDGEETDAVEA